VGIKLYAVHGSHPCAAVARALEENRLEMHGWVYDLADGRIRAYDPKVNRFELLEKTVSRAP